MSNLRDSRIPASDCPFCGYVMDHATAAPSNRESTPEPGSLSICTQCASILIFDDDLHQRAPAQGEIDAIFRTNARCAEEVRRVQRAIRSLDRRKRA